MIVTGDTVSQGKPHPEPYEKAAAILGVDPRDTVAIEDSNTGARSARGRRLHGPGGPEPRAGASRRAAGLRGHAGRHEHRGPAGPGRDGVDLMPTPVRVTALRRYPVKACAGEPLEVASVGEDGFRSDRVLAVVVDGAVVTQREHPRLARVRPSSTTRPPPSPCRTTGRPSVEGVVDTTAPTRTVTIFGEPVAVVDQADALSAWCSEMLQRPAQLVAAPVTTRRTEPGGRRGTDGARGRGRGVAALRGVARQAQRGARGAGAPGAAARTGSGPTSSIGGCPAHAEDDTALFEAGAVRMAFAQVDERCAVDHDRPAGERAGPEPLRTLADYRRRDGVGGVAFGIYTSGADARHAPGGRPGHPGPEVVGPPDNGGRPVAGHRVAA